MKKRIRLLAMILAASMMVQTPVYASSVKDLQNQKSKTQQELNKVNENISNLQKNSQQTQNEINEASAKLLVQNGCCAVAEGANMPSTPEAIAYLQANGVLFAPAKASNAGGVATSGLEMSQNSLRLSWTFEEVDERLHNIMVNIYHNIDDAAKRYGKEGDYVAGANIAGMGFIIEKAFQKGGELLREKGIHVESLAIIESLDDCEIKIRQY